MNAVIYARYSSNGQREESIEGQLRECREYAVGNILKAIEQGIFTLSTKQRLDELEFCLCQAPLGASAATQLLDFLIACGCRKIISAGY